LPAPAAPPPQQQSPTAQPVRFWALPTPGSTTTTVVTTTSSSNSSPHVNVVLPIPYRLPPQRYCPAVDKPWVWDADHPGLDVLGRTCNQPASLYGHVQPPGGDE
jgi:hypothetical protein